MFRALASFASSLGQLGNGKGDIANLFKVLGNVGRLSHISPPVPAPCPEPLDLAHEATPCAPGSSVRNVRMDARDGKGSESGIPSSFPGTIQRQRTHQEGQDFQDFPRVVLIERCPLSITARRCGPALCADGARERGQFVASEQAVDDVRDAGRLLLGGCRRDSAGRHELRRSPSR